jgi:hypothetical protein
MSLVDRVRAVSAIPWKAVSGLAAIATSLGLACFLGLLKTDTDGFVFLDYANLAFHEAGHPIFGMLGSTLGLYGGTLGQLVFPVVALLAFWRQREPIGVYGGGGLVVRKFSEHRAVHGGCPGAGAPAGGWWRARLDRDLYAVGRLVVRYHHCSHRHGSGVDRDADGLGLADLEMEKFE